jgi:hypothetical protein
MMLAHSVPAGERSGLGRELSASGGVSQHEWHWSDGADTHGQRGVVQSGAIRGTGPAAAGVFVIGVGQRHLQLLWVVGLFMQLKSPRILWLCRIGGGLAYRRLDG